MVFDALAARFKFLLHGRVEGGQCPKCGLLEVTLTEEGLNCGACEYQSDLPEVDGWV